jgi:DNA-binding response OmpR family regulator
LIRDFADAGVAHLRLDGVELPLRQRQEVAHRHSDDRMVIGTVIRLGDLRSDAEDSEAKSDESENGKRGLEEPHANVSTPLAMTSPLRPMSCECHVGRRILRGMRVLVVEDHATLAGRIAQGLRQAGMAVDAVHDGAAAITAASQTAYEVIVLDRDLPVVHGDHVCRALAGSGPRILMLTAAAQVDDRVDGLELGADDYLGKPFVFAELVARVRALSRRAPSAPPVLRRGDLTVDRARHRASRGTRALSLTRKEFGILEMLLAADGAVVSAEKLLEHVWDAEVDPFSNIVSVTMTRLRRKLGDPPLIETVVGKGYRM